MMVIGTYDVVVNTGLLQFRILGFSEWFQFSDIVFPLNVIDVKEVESLLE